MDTELPQRPGVKACAYYKKHGRCGYGANCKYHHPKQPGVAANQGATHNSKPAKDTLNPRDTNRPEVRETGLNGAPDGGWRSEQKDAVKEKLNFVLDDMGESLDQCEDDIHQAFDRMLNQKGTSLKDVTDTMHQVYKDGYLALMKKMYLWQEELANLVDSLDHDSHSDASYDTSTPTSNGRTPRRKDQHMEHDLFGWGNGQTRSSYPHSVNANGVQGVKLNTHQTPPAHQSMPHVTQHTDKVPTAPPAAAARTAAAAQTDAKAEAHSTSSTSSTSEHIQAKSSVNMHTTTSPSPPFIFSAGTSKPQTTTAASTTPFPVTNRAAAAGGNVSAAGQQNQQQQSGQQQDTAVDEQPPLKQHRQHSPGFVFSSNSAADFMAGTGGSQSTGQSTSQSSGQSTATPASSSADDANTSDMANGRIPAFKLAASRFSFHKLQGQTPVPGHYTEGQFMPTRHTTPAPPWTVPASTVSTPTVPMPTVPAPTVPAPAVPASTVPAPTVPAPTVPASTVPAPTVPASTVPASTTPTPTIPASQTQANTKKKATQSVKQSQENQAKPTQTSKTAKAPASGSAATASNGPATRLPPVSKQAFEQAKSKSMALKAKATEEYKNKNFFAAEWQYQKAIQEFEKLGPVAGCLDQHTDVLVDLAVLYSNKAGAKMMRGRVQEALEDSVKSYELDPTFARAYIRACTCCVRLGQVEEAEKHLQQGIEKAGRTKDKKKELQAKLKEVAELAQQRQKLLDAVHQNITVEQLKKLNEDCGSVFEEMRECPVLKDVRTLLLLRGGLFSQVLAACSTEECPDPCWEWWLRLQVKYHEGSLEEAIKLAEEGSSLLAAHNSESSTKAASHKRPCSLPTSAELESTISNMKEMVSLKQQGNDAVGGQRWQEAVDKYTAALSLNPPLPFSAVLHCNRSLAHHNLKNLVDATADAARSKALNPKYAKAYQRLSTMLSTMKRSAVAVATLTSMKEQCILDLTERFKAESRIADARRESSRQKVPDHYKFLELTQQCTEGDIRKAYKKMALRYHPDKALSSCKFGLQLGESGLHLAVGMDVEKRIREEASSLFSFIGQAHEELSDKTRRRKVDMLLDDEDDNFSFPKYYRPNPFSSNFSPCGHYTASRPSNQWWRYDDNEDDDEDEYETDDGEEIHDDGFMYDYY